MTQEQLSGAPPGSGWWETPVGRAHSPPRRQKWLGLTIAPARKPNKHPQVAFWVFAFKAIFH